LNQRTRFQSTLWEQIPEIVFVERIVIREVLLNIGHLLQRSDLLSFRLCSALGLYAASAL